MKKIIGIILLIFMLACNNVKTEKEIDNNYPVFKGKITKYLEKEFPGDKFYFIYGLHKERSFATNINYRGGIYSKRLNELNYVGFLELATENLNINQSKLYNLGNEYKNILWNAEYNGRAEKKAREIFGEKCNFINNWTLTRPKKINLLANYGKKNIAFNKKNSAINTVVDLFVDDLEKIDNEDLRKKTFKLAKYIYETLNYKTSLQIYVRDNDFFKNYDLVYYSIFKPFREKPEVKEILVKIKNKNRISDDEKTALIRHFDKPIMDFTSVNYKKYLITTKSKNDKLKIETIFISPIIGRKNR